jgi:alkanesulfonate monooxygenase SsuD/methylene tetrahydromethanopterin reductase-like flavin-dependent oxidoreductase (luciferase family)
VEYGAHLPLIDFGTPVSLSGLKAYARTASTLGYRYLCANDHLLFSRPWLDGPTALAAVIDESDDLTLATTVSLPVMRGPVQLAKTLTALDVLSGGRVVAGVGPGSSARDYAAVGVPHEERWPRFDETLQTLRALFDGPDGFDGHFYATRDVSLEPRPAQARLPIWVASWGSPAGLRRVARFGDGWLASAYNTTPAAFADGLTRLAEAMRRENRDATAFPNGIATAWLYVTEDTAAAERMLADVLAPMLRRSVDELRSLSLPIGPAELCAERLTAFAHAGAQRLFVWPLRDDVAQIELFRERVVPLVTG